jgi:hypothetical protein
MNVFERSKALATFSKIERIEVIHMVIAVSTLSPGDVAAAYWRFLIASNMPFTSASTEASLPNCSAAAADNFWACFAVV